MYTTKLEKFTISYLNQEEYHVIKRELFTEQLYHFVSHRPDPVILDVGAHIGLATLYFKKLYPAARIIAIEPLPENFSLLEENVFQNNLSEVTVINCAVSEKNGQLVLHTDQNNTWHSTASVLPGNWTGSQKTRPVVVPTRTLADLIGDQTIDLLKMDIEGAEQAVLVSAGKKLQQIRQLLCEFHPHSGQSLKKLMAFLTGLGFVVTLEKNQQTITLDKASGLVMIRAIRNSL